MSKSEDASAAAVTVRRRPCALDPDELHGVPPLLARLYASRGIRTSADAGLELRDMLPVSSLAGSAAAVELLLAHRAAGSHVLVVGDFDADGATHPSGAGRIRDHR